MLEFETAFGGPQRVGFKVTQPADPAAVPAVDLVAPTSAFSLYYALNLYFRNGGGPCYVVSIGTYDASPSRARFSAGLAALEKEDEPTLIVLTDAAGLLSASDYYTLCGEALAAVQEAGRPLHHHRRAEGRLAGLQKRRQPLGEPDVRRRLPSLSADARSATTTTSRTSASSVRVPPSTSRDRSRWATPTASASASPVPSGACPRSRSPPAPSPERWASPSRPSR